MQIGLIGLGRMGSGIARRLAGAGHDVVGYDLDASRVASLEGPGLGRASSASQLIEQLAAPRTVWLMLPAGDPVEETVRSLAASLGTDAVIVDGGNSNYRDSVRRHGELRSRGIALVDVGTSGGVRGETDGYCLMAGGETAAVDRLRPLFQALAPSPDQGWGHVGPPGAGHFSKMVHNGIEYGMMQALAEGFALLERRREFDLDPAQIARIWQSGSVIRSWLLELAGGALARDPGLAGVRSQVDDSGEGRWAVAEAIDLDVAAPVITHSLIARLASRDPASFSNRLLSALRREFGGHRAEPRD